MEREALRKINLIFGERIMKDGNAGNGVEFAGGNMPVIANGGNMPVMVADHLEVQPLGHVVSGDTVSDL